jgi:hypothetical protein
MNFFVFFGKAKIIAVFDLPNLFLGLFFYFQIRDCLKITFLFTNGSHPELVEGFSSNRFITKWFDML